MQYQDSLIVRPGPRPFLPDKTWTLQDGGNSDQRLLGNVSTFNLSAISYNRIRSVAISSSDAGSTLASVTLVICHWVRFTIIDFLNIFIRILFSNLDIMSTFCTFSLSRVPRRPSLPCNLHSVYTIKLELQYNHNSDNLLLPSSLTKIRKHLTRRFYI